MERPIAIKTLENKIDILHQRTYIEQVKSLSFMYGGLHSINPSISFIPSLYQSDPTYNLVTFVVKVISSIPFIDALIQREKINY